MRLDDPALPAARHLVGDGARDVLRVPVEATGGQLESVRVVNVRYRPGSDVVVRYSAMVSWSGAAAVRETLVAASAVHGAYPGVALLTASTPHGPIEVGVWRYPFDPVLVGLAEAATRSSAAELLDLPRDGTTVRIIAYRPTDRVVTRVSHHDRPVAYLKVVAPERTEAIAERHRRLRAGGVPAPALLRVEPERGLIAMEPLLGPTLRELIKRDDGASMWPAPERVIELCSTFAGCDLTGRGPNSRIADGELHAAMLATVLPGMASTLDRLAAAFGGEPPPVDGVIHGDLHEGQLVIDGGEIVGVLDVDDSGPGCAADDIGNLLAHLHYRDVTATAGDIAQLAAYRQRLHDAAVDAYGPEPLSRHTAAALVGLATGPFRLQSPGWADQCSNLIERARAISDRTAG